MRVLMKMRARSGAGRLRYDPTSGRSDGFIEWARRRDGHPGGYLIEDKKRRSSRVTSSGASTLLT